MPSITPNGLAGIKDAADLIIRSRKTNKPVLTIDYANSFSVSFKSDSVSAKKKGQDSITWAKNMEGTAKISVEMLNSSLIAFLLGSPTLNEMVSFYKREVFDITTSDQQVTLKDTPKTGSVTAFKIRKDGSTHIAEIANPTVATNKVTLTGVVATDKVAVYYLTEKQANHFKIAGKKLLTEDYYVNCITTTKLYEDGSEVPIELELFKVQPEASLELQFDAENPSKFEINLKLMIDENGNMGDWKEVPMA